MKKSFEIYSDEAGEREVIHHFYTDTYLVISKNEELRTMLHSKYFYLAVDKTNNQRKEIRLRLSKEKKESIKRNPMLSRVAFDCYYNGLRGCDYIQYGIKNNEYNSKDAPTIDHLDNDWRNNTKENLFEMTRGENTDKQHKQKKVINCFPLPFYVSLANDGTFCRLQFVYTTSHGRLFAVRFRCKDGASINDCLSYLWENKWRIREQKDGVLLEDGADYALVRRSKIFPFFKQIEPLNKYALAEKIVSMPEGDFPLFDGGMLE